MSIESYIAALTLSIQENTRVTGELVNLLKERQGKPEKDSSEPVQKAQKKPASGVKAGLGEKTETPPHADAPEADVNPTVTEPEPRRKKKLRKCLTLTLKKLREAAFVRPSLGCFEVGLGPLKPRPRQLKSATPSWVIPSRQQTLWTMSST